MSKYAGKRKCLFIRFGYRVPWNYDEEAVQVLSKFTKLKCSLMPYLYHAATQAHKNGTPMLRSMLLEFPDDPACTHLDLQYMLGDSLLVAPIFTHDGSVSYYVPAGVWTNLLNGNQVEGPGWKRETHDFTSLPLLARPNSVIPIGNRDDRPDYDFSDGVTLHIHQLESGHSAKVEIPTVNGKIETTFEIERKGQEIHIQRVGPAKQWNINLAGISSIKSADDQKIEMQNGSTKISVEKQTSEIVIQIT